MQSSQVRNVGLPTSAEAKRDVPAWTQDPKIFPLDWFSVSRPNIIRQTKEYVSELSKWRNCPKIKTLSKLKAVLKRIMMFLHSHTSYIDGKSLLECDLEEDLITLVSLYMDMELRVLLIKKSAPSGPGLGNAPGREPKTDMDTARNDKLVSDRISYWLYTVLTGHDQRVDALLSTTVYSRHTRPVLDPIFRKILSEISDGPFSNVNYVRHMLAYKTWRERALTADDVASEELNSRVLQQLVPRDYAFPPPLLRCLGKGDNVREHARPHNLNLADACRHFMRCCREMPAAAAEQINFESIPLLDDDMLCDEENEVNHLMDMISNRKQRMTAPLSPSGSSSLQVDAFIDLTLPNSRTKANSRKTVSHIIDLTEEDEKPKISSRTSAVLEPPVATPSRTALAVQRINTPKKPQPPQDCSYAITPSTPQVETRCFTAYRDQDIYLVNISCMCPVRAHRQRECQCQDKKTGHFKENKALKTALTERKDATFVGRCFQFSIGNKYGYPSEDDVDTEIQPLVVDSSQDQVKLELRSSTAGACNTNDNETRAQPSEFCDKLFSDNLNHCDCDGCKQNSNLTRYKNRTCTSAKIRDQSVNELSDINIQCNQNSVVACAERLSHASSVADMYAMEKTSPIVLQPQPSTSLFEGERHLEHFTETLDKRKIQLNENTNSAQNDEILSSNSKNEIRKIKLPLVGNKKIKYNNVNLSIETENVSAASTNVALSHGEIKAYEKPLSPVRIEENIAESTNFAIALTSSVNVESQNASVISDKICTESSKLTAATILGSTNQVPNVQSEALLHTSDTDTAILELYSVISNVNTTTEKDEKIATDKDIFQNNLPEEIIDSLSRRRSNVLENVVSEITNFNVIEKNLEISSESLQTTQKVSKHHMDTPTEERAEVSEEYSSLQSIQTDCSETLDSESQLASKIVENVDVPNIENNLEISPNSLNITQDVSTYHIETPAEKITKINDVQPYCNEQLNETLNSVSESMCNVLENVIVPDITPIDIVEKNLEISPNSSEIMQEVNTEISTEERAEINDDYSYLQSEQIDFNEVQLGETLNCKSESTYKVSEDVIVPDIVENSLDIDPDITQEISTCRTGTPTEDCAQINDYSSLQSIQTDCNEEQIEEILDFESESTCEVEKKLEISSDVPQEISMCRTETPTEDCAQINDYSSLQSVQTDCNVLPLEETPNSESEYTCKVLENVTLPDETAVNIVEKNSEISSNSLEIMQEVNTETSQENAKINDYFSIQPEQTDCTEVQLEETFNSESKSSCNDSENIIVTNLTAVNINEKNLEVSPNIMQEVSTCRSKTPTEDRSDINDEYSIVQSVQTDCSEEQLSKTLDYEPKSTCNALENVIVTDIIQKNTEKNFVTSQENNTYHTEYSTEDRSTINKEFSSLQSVQNDCNVVQLEKMPDSEPGNKSAVNIVENNLEISSDTIEEDSTDCTETPTENRSQINDEYTSLQFEQTDCTDVHLEKSNNSELESTCIVLENAAVPDITAVNIVKKNLTVSPNSLEITQELSTKISSEERSEINDDYSFKQSACTDFNEEETTNFESETTCDVLESVTIPDPTAVDIIQNSLDISPNNSEITQEINTETPAEESSKINDDYSDLQSVHNDCSEDQLEKTLNSDSESICNVIENVIVPDLTAVKNNSEMCPDSSEISQEVSAETSIDEHTEINDDYSILQSLHTDCNKVQIETHNSESESTCEILEKGTVPDLTADNIQNSLEISPNMLETRQEVSADIPTEERSEINDDQSNLQSVHNDYNEAQLEETVNSELESTCNNSENVTVLDLTADQIIQNSLEITSKSSEITEEISTETRTGDSSEITEEISTETQTEDRSEINEDYFNLQSVHNNCNETQFEETLNSELESTYNNSENVTEPDITAVDIIQKSLEISPKSSEITQEINTETPREELSEINDDNSNLQSVHTDCNEIQLEETLNSELESTCNNSENVTVPDITAVDIIQKNFEISPNSSEITEEISEIPTEDLSDIDDHSNLQSVNTDCNKAQLEETLNSESESNCNVIENVTKPDLTAVKNNLGICPDSSEITQEISAETSTEERSEINDDYSKLQSVHADCNEAQLEETVNSKSESACNVLENVPDLTKVDIIPKSVEISLNCSEVTQEISTETQTENLTEINDSIQSVHSKCNEEQLLKDEFNSDSEFPENVKIKQEANTESLSEERADINYEHSSLQLIQTDYSEVELQEKLNTTLESTCNILENLTERNLPDVNFIDNNLKKSSNNLEAIQDVNTYHIETPAEKRTEVIQEHSNLQPLETDSTQVQLDENMITSIEENFDDTRRDNCTTEEIISTKTILSHPENAMHVFDGSSNVAQLNYDQQQTPEVEMVIESEIVVESIPEVTDTTTHILEATDDNQLVCANSKSAPVSDVEPDTIIHENLLKIATIFTNISNAESKIYNIRKRKKSLAAKIPVKEISVGSKSDISNLPPRKKFKRKPIAATEEINNKDQHKQSVVDLLREECSLKTNVENVLNIPRRKSVNESLINTEILSVPELIKDITIKNETAQNINISDTNEQTTSVSDSSKNSIIPEEVSESKLSDKNIYEQNLTAKNTLSAQKTETYSPKRRRKQNLKNLRDDKTTSSIIAKVDKSTTPSKTKELRILCKNLSKSEIEVLCKNKMESLSESNLKSTAAEEIQNHRKNKPSKKPHMKKDICVTTCSNTVEEIIKQSTKTTEDETEQSKTKLNQKQKNVAIESNCKTTLNGNFEDITVHSDVITSEKEKSTKIKMKPGRKSKSTLNNEDKIKNKATEDHVANSSIKSIVTESDTKIKRPRGRPPKIISNKLKFFSENFNLKNLNNTKCTNQLSSNINEDFNLVQDINTSQYLEMPEEDVPLAFRMSLSVPQKINLLKSSKTDVLENELIKSDDNFSTTKKQRSKSVQSIKSAKKCSEFNKNDKIPEVTHENKSKIIQKCNKLQKEFLPKPKLVEKLSQFKFQPKSNTESTQNFTVQEELNDTFSLKKFDTENKPKKIVRTYSNTKTEKKQELIFDSENSTIKTKKAKKLISNNIINVEAKNFDKTAEDIYSNIPKPKIYVCEDEQLINTNINSQDNVHSEIANIPDKTLSNKARSISDTMQMIENINTREDSVPELTISCSFQINNSNFLPERVISNATTEDKSYSNNSEIVQKITVKPIEMDKLISNDFNKSSKNSVVDDKKYTTNTNNESVKNTSQQNSVPKILSKRAREKLFVVKKKNFAVDNLIDIKYPIKEINKKDTNESKNILNHAKFKEDSISENQELQQISTTDDEIKCIDKALISESSRTEYQKNEIQTRDSCKLIENKEQEISTINQEEIIPQPSEITATTVKNGNNLIKNETIICAQVSPIFQEDVDKNIDGIMKPIELLEDKKTKPKEITDSVLLSTHKSSSRRKSKFPKLKLKLSNIADICKSDPKLKSPVNKNNKFKSKLKERKNKIKIQVRKSKKPLINVKKSQHSPDLNEENCKNVSSNSNDPENVTNTSIKFENISHEVEDKKMDFKTSPVSNTNKQNISEKIKGEIEIAKIDNKSEDMLYKPYNKVYEKQFDFYSDQDDVSNSELVIDTSAESSDAEDKIQEDKNNLVNSEVTISEQTKYHSIPEINENVPIEDINTKSFCDSVIIVTTQKVEDCENNSEDLTAKQSITENNASEEIVEPTLYYEHNANKEQENNISNSQILDQVEETKKNSIISKEIVNKHQESNNCDKEFDSSLIPVVEETIVQEMVVDEANYLKVDTVFDQRRVESTVEKFEETNIRSENKTAILEERTADIIEISEEVSHELHIEAVNEEKIPGFIEPYGPSVEILMNIEVGFESCTFSEKGLVEDQYAKEGCVKCSVNGKHKENKRTAVRGIHQYQENEIEECLEESAIIPAIPYCQAVEIYELNSCDLIAKVESVKILTHETPEDTYNLCVLADIATNSIHLNTKTENNNILEVTAESSNHIHNQGSLQEGEECFYVTFPEKVPITNKTETNISVINNNDEEISIKVQKLAEGLNTKGILLENKIQLLTERVKNGTRINEENLQALTQRTKNGTRLNGENLDELYKSLENICELEINTLTKTPPKSDGLNHLASVSVPVDIPSVISKIPEPNISIDIPNTALLHLTPDYDDFVIRNEPFNLQSSAVPSESLETSISTTTDKKTTSDTTGVIKNLYSEIDTLTNNAKIISTENENSSCTNIKEPGQEIKTKSKKGRSKSKSSNNHNSEAVSLLDKYKSNQDSNKQDVSNQQNICGNKTTSASPPSYIRSTRPMRMVTTRKRNINVLDNSNSVDEPAKKVSASEKMFDKLLEEHRKELSVAKLKDETNEETVEDTGVKISEVNNKTMPLIDNDMPETNKLPTFTSPTEEFNTSLPILHYEVSNNNSKNEKIQIELKSPKNSIEELKLKSSKPETSKEYIEESQKNIPNKQYNKEDQINTKIIEKTAPDTTLTKEIASSNSTCDEGVITNSDKEKQEKKGKQEEATEESNEINTNAQAEINKFTEEEEEEVPNAVDRNASAIEVVQDWFNRVDSNKSHTEPYTEITSYQTIEECNFFEEVSSASENSPNARKNDEKVFSEHQTPDSGIAFDEDSVQRFKSVPENISDGETNYPPKPVSYFCNLNKMASGKMQQVEITNLELIVPPGLSKVTKKKLNVSIALERIKDILPLLMQHKMSSPERKIKKRKESTLDTDRGRKRKHSSEEVHLNSADEKSSNNAILKDCKIKRRKHLNDYTVQECTIEEAVSPAPSQRDISSTFRTKGAVKEYPDCLFGITESPVPSGSFHSPYPSDISLTEEPVFYEEGGIDLCNDYPVYDSFEVLQEQQSLHDDNPKDVQQGLQAGYCVVDSQFLPLSEYMNDGDYILIDNKIFNDKRMVPVNMHQVQPETKPHNEVKRNEFDDSEKEDSLTETVDEIIKNPNVFPEQSSSKVQVINMDQATSEVQVVIACDTYQETEMTDTYLVDTTSQNELTTSDNTSTPSPLNLEEETPESKVTNKPVNFKPATPVVGSENEQFCNPSVVPVAVAFQPAAMELIKDDHSISKPVVTHDVIKKNKELPEQKSEDKVLPNLYDTVKIKSRNANSDERKKEETQNKLTTLSSTQNNLKIFPKPAYSKSTKTYERSTSNGKEISENKNLKTSIKNQSTSSITVTSFKDQKKHDYHLNKKNINPKKFNPDQKLQVLVQKPLLKKYDSAISSQNLSPNHKPDPKMYSKQYSRKTSNSKVPIDAFDKLKQELTDNTPINRRTHYNSSNSDSNFVKNRFRRNMSPADFNKRFSGNRDSIKMKHNSQGASDSRRPQSAYTEPSPKPAYRLPPSDPTYRSSQYNNKKPEVKTSHSKVEESNHNQTTSSAHKDWLKNENLLNLIKTANTIYNKKY